MSKEDKNFLWSLMPDWVKEQPNGLDPTFYGTLSKEGDKKIKDKVESIIGKEGTI